jgi:hypothetical protein
MWGIRYLTAYAIGTVFGVLNEYVQKPHQPLYNVPNYSHFMTCGAANLYGWSLLSLTAYFDLMEHAGAPAALSILAVSPMLTILEAIFGAVSKWYFKEQRWKYPDSYFPALGGTISLVSGMYFGIVGVLYWLALYRPFISKL